MELARSAVDIGYVVTDLEAMTAFYGDGLGLPIISEETLGDDFPGGGRTVRCFAAGETLLKLWALHAGPPPAGSDERLGQVGMRYTTMHVRGLHELVAHLGSLGYPVASPPRRSALGAARLLAWVRDPDGNHIELVESDEPT